jgi:hypothetical protein
MTVGQKGLVEAASRRTPRRLEVATWGRRIEASPRHCEKQGSDRVARHKLSIAGMLLHGEKQGSSRAAKHELSIAGMLH